MKTYAGVEGLRAFLTPALCGG